jgi:transcription termination/antitermination protein NusG
MNFSEQEEEHLEPEDTTSPVDAEPSGSDESDAPAIDSPLGEEPVATDMDTTEDDELDAPATDSPEVEEVVKPVMDTTEDDEPIVPVVDITEDDKPVMPVLDAAEGDEIIVPVLDSLEEFQISEEGIDQEGDGRAWYVVHCYSGYENKVRHNLEQRIESMGMKDKIFDIVVPTEEEIEVKEGKRRTVERRVFPGYILVNMILSEESWYVVRNTPGVTGFVGMGNNPTPLRPEEVSQIIRRMEAEAPRIKVTFKSGERVRIVDGPFNDFRGTVSEIDMERAKVRVMVNFFGRETPVELDFLQVEKT